MNTGPFREAETTHATGWSFVSADETLVSLPPYEGYAPRGRG
ncbi:hypothetical protein [Streptomyces sp. NPDC056948]